MINFEIHALKPDPAVMNQVIDLNYDYFSSGWGFNQDFKKDIQQYSDQFIGNFDPDKDGAWVALTQEGIIGAIIFDGQSDAPQAARLRLFIVAQDYQGHGVGRSLLNKAIEFGRQTGYPKMCLWTFARLARAKSLYKKIGFRQTQEREVEYWGRRLIEQKYELALQTKSSV